MRLSVFLFLSLTITLSAQPEKSAKPLTAPRILPAKRTASLAPSARYHLAEIPALRLNAPSAKERTPTVRRGLSIIGLERKPGTLSGRWETVAENQQLWRLRIVSPGARSVQLHLRNVNHAAGKFFVSGEELTAPDSVLWSPAIPGDELTFEYEPLPGDNTHNLPFEIAGLVHIYGPLDATAPSCYVDVACSPNPRADSVGLLIFTNPDDGKTYSCTGTLVNIANASAEFEAVPLFLTAGHCITTQDEASSAFIEFHYQAITCGGSSTAPETFSRPPATLLATTPMEQGDHALLRLSAFPTDSLTEPVLAGWSTADLPPAGLVSLHHVAGLRMKESQGIRLPDGDSTVGGQLAPADQFFRVGFTYGAAGQGASGAGIFDQSGTLFGTLSYGPAGSCQMYAGFGRMSAGFDALAPWLSGSGSGVAVAALTLPVPDSKLDSTSPTFVWKSVPGASGYSLYVGDSGPGSGNAFSQDYLSAGDTTATPTRGMPAAVTNLWARLITHFPFGSWYNDYVFQADLPSESSIYMPEPGGTLDGGLWWTPMRALSYTVTIGDTGPGSSDLFSQIVPNYKGTPLQLSPHLPDDGRKLYVRLAWTTLMGSGYKDYAYTAPLSVSPVHMISPQPYSVLAPGDAAFQWTPVPGALSYDLIAYMNNGKVEMDGLTGASATLTGIPANGQQITVQIAWHTEPTGLAWGSQSFVYNTSVPDNLPPAVSTTNPTITAGAWVSVYGTNLSQTTRSWTPADFVDGKLPTSLDGVSVQVSGQSAYISYISPAQINFLVPASCCQNGTAVTVTNSLGASTRPDNVVATLAPTLFTLPQLGGIYAVATFPDGSVIGPAGLLGDAAKTRPAQTGDIIVLWASGLGQTDPALPDGQLITQPLPVADNVSVQIGGANAQVDYAGLVEAGLYQLNIHVPKVPSGDEPVSIKIGQYNSLGPLYISVK